MMRKHLAKKRKVKIDGRERSISQGELLIITTVRDALEGKSKDARKQVLADMARMSPAATPESAEPAGRLNEADRLTLDEFCQTVREDIMAEFGIEPDPKPESGDEG